MSRPTSFNIRVYGLFINDKEEILLADEKRFDTFMTKFPGGGLIPGEGTIDCLKREAMEEFGQEIEVMRHFYTTDFFQKSRFDQNQQLISVYYLAEFIELTRFIIAKSPFDFKNNGGEIVSFRYKKIIDIQEKEMSFPIDKLVLEMLKQEYNKSVENK